MSKTILITGATNGIGLAAAEALASLGENIAIVGRNETRTKIAAAKSAGQNMQAARRLWEISEAQCAGKGT